MTAIQEIRQQQGKHFDPEMVETFLSIQDEIVTIKNMHLAWDCGR
jgi:response regulator RpfG family c-di-GMP phosphodiesterase